MQFLGWHEGRDWDTSGIFPSIIIIGTASLYAFIAVSSSDSFLKFTKKLMNQALPTRYQLSPSLKSSFKASLARSTESSTFFFLSSSTLAHPILVPSDLRRMDWLRSDLLFFPHCSNKCFYIFDSHLKRLPRTLDILLLPEYVAKRIPTLPIHRVQLDLRYSSHILICSGTLLHSFHIRVACLIDGPSEGITLLEVASSIRLH